MKMPAKNIKLVKNTSFLLVFCLSLFVLVTNQSHAQSQVDWRVENGDWGRGTNWNTNNSPSWSQRVNLNKGQTFIKSHINNRQIVMKGGNLYIGDNASLRVREALSHQEKNGSIIVSGGTLSLDNNSTMRIANGNTTSNIGNVTLRRGTIKAFDCLWGAYSGKFSYIQGGGDFNARRIYLATRGKNSESKLNISNGKFYAEQLYSDNNVNNRGKIRFNIFENRADITCKYINLNESNTTFSFQIGGGISPVKAVHANLSNTTIEVDISHNFNGRVGNKYRLFQCTGNVNINRIKVSNTSDRHVFTIAKEGRNIVARLSKIKNDESDYKKIFIAKTRQLYDNILRHEYVSLAKKSSYIHKVSNIAASMARVFEYTGDLYYLESSKRMLDEVTKNRVLDFFVPANYMLAYEILHKYAYITESERIKYQKYAEATFIKRGEQYPLLHNQTYTKAVGLALAAKYFPRSSFKNDWYNYANDLLMETISISDFHENATSYNAICLFEIIHLAKVLNKEGELKRGGMRNLFRRYADQIAPSGFMPSYGDSGRGFNNRKDQFMVDDWARWIAIFEKAAALSNDGTLRTNASMVMENFQKNGLSRLGTSIHDASVLLRLSDAYDWRNANIGKRNLNSNRTRLQRRSLANGGVGFSKVILDKSSARGKPYVISDILVDGFTSHAHMEQYAAIDYFEMDGVMLMTNSGKNNQHAAHNNTLYVANNDNEFPFTTRDLIPHKKWMKVSIPTSRLHNEGGNMRSLGQILNFRTDPNKDAIILLDAMKLKGSSGEILVDHLDGFNYGANSSRSNISRDGRGSLRLNVKKGIQFNTKGINTRSFDSKKYPVLEFWWRVETSGIDITRPLIVRFSKSGEKDINFYATVDHIIEPKITGATVNRNAATSKVDYDDWFEFGSKYTRQTKLLDNGTLIVKDCIKPSQSMVNKVVGPVWQLLPNGSHQKKNNWFVQKGDTKDMLIYISKKDNNTKYNWVKHDLWSLTDHTTAYAKRKVTNRNDINFTTVLVPFDRGTINPDVLASQIKITTNGCNSDVIISNNDIGRSRTAFRNAEGTEEIDLIEENANAVASIFPSPASDRLTISFEGRGSYTLILYDMSGNPVLNDEGLTEGEVTLNTGSLRSGVYSAIAELDGKRISVQRILIVN